MQSTGLAPEPSGFPSSEGFPEVSRLELKMTKICYAPECAAPAKTMGMCTKHYWRLKRTGSLEARSKAKNGDGIAWLNAHAAHVGHDCLKWPFGSPRNGYGQVRIDGIDVPATRYMCIAAHGRPPSAGHQAAHSCGKGHEGCVNPKHLRWATPVENSADLKVHKLIRGPIAAQLITAE